MLQHLFLSWGSNQGVHGQCLLKGGVHSKGVFIQEGRLFKRGVYSRGYSKGLFIPSGAYSRGGIYSRVAFIKEGCSFKGGIHSKGRLFKGVVYSRVAFIQEGLLVKGGI